MSENEQPPEVTLPGYQLIEKIGSGGYGEVWSADAPGGLRKAIKFVYGNQFDKRAASELNALEKVRAVRHPFLLSLERIEIIEGRLIVVCELADGSLRDRFRACVEQGLPGIPREELLRYLADAADALDFIGAEHDLAHLDIKPENLLLVAGHVKVADFGLVKSVSDRTQVSLVGGMTPTYAAPEVFRGSPTRRSDQYSLAVLYQELLTGTTPFPGVNAAELTLQHLNDDPRLGSLAESDHFAVARALAKDPNNRFQTASAFVAALREPRPIGQPTSSLSGAAPRSREAPRAPRASEHAAARHSVTEVFDEPVKEAARSRPDSVRITPEPLEAPDPVERPAPEAVNDSGSFAATPAVFIGVGGAAARVFRSLRLLMSERLGCEGPLPAAPLLLLDTDPQTLSAATRGAERGLGLTASETLSLPLRRPQDYREKAELLLRWLGRRWLYNMPRSQRTEGIRPLGRLALVDHARQAFQRIRGVLTQAIDPGSSELSADAIGLPFSGGGVRVYVVGSSAGGASSGMSIDVAYAVRAMLQRLRVEQSRLIGVISHSTSRDSTQAELAWVNSYSWLSEFENFRSGAEGYPGDDSVGLPSHAAGVAAFDDTYFVPLGERIDTPQFESAADAVAEYLFADAFTSNQRVLDACRDQSARVGPTLRSFAVLRRDGQSGLEMTAEERGAVARMLDRWIGGNKSEGVDKEQVATSTDTIVHGSVAFLGRAKLDASTLASNSRALIEASLGGDANAYAEARFGELQRGQSSEVAAAVDRCFARAGSSLDQVDGRSIEAIVDPMVAKLGDLACAWVLDRVNNAQERVEGARRALGWFQDHLVALDGEFQKLAARVASEHHATASETVQPSQGPAGLALTLFRLRLDQAALAGARSVVAGLLRKSQELPEVLTAFERVVTSVRDEVVRDFSVDDCGEDAQRLSLAIEQRLESDYLAAGHGLVGALNADEASGELLKAIAHVAKMLARDASSGSRTAANASRAVGFAEPPWTAAGGEYFQLSLQSRAVEGESIERDRDLLRVTEQSGVSLPHVAAQLIGGRRDYAAFAERVRTRRDIPWVDAVAGSDNAGADEQGANPFEASGPMATALLG